MYSIGVAAVLVGTGVQNLRAYEKAGLVAPDRTVGGTRLYSQDDIAVIQRVVELLDDGLNLIGITLVLRLEDENRRLRDRIDRDGASPEDEKGRTDQSASD